MNAKAIQLAVLKELEIDYEVLQEREKHLRAKKKRAGGVIWEKKTLLE